MPSKNQNGALDLTLNFSFEEGTLIPFKPLKAPSGPFKVKQNLLSTNLSLSA